MNQLCKQVATVTGHDCALKRLESDALAAQVAEHLAHGGTVTVVPGYAPKPRPVSYMSKNVQQSITKKDEKTRQMKVLELVKKGLSNSGDIANALKIDVKEANSTLRQIEKKGLVKGAFVGNSTAKVWKVPGEKAA
ncbi:response regulator transcription factor [Alkanindiges illinoisensis]|uniref:response regulator transcription factor n=1 Tax=Alkanindiges illinoisensis TaxID=197183 RepID=UPI000478CFBE|nr:response regulator transcription factor [Alkanindiges illinoisensis]